MLPALQKAKRPSGVPSGFSRIPKGKRGGYRKKVGDHYAYWYPDEHKAEPHLDWEDDLGAGRGTAAIEPGHFVTIIGSRKMYSWTPEAGKTPPEGKTWVTALPLPGPPVLVDTAKIQPQRSFNPDDRKRKRKKPEPKWKTRHDPEALKRRKKKVAPPTPKKKTPLSDELETQRKRRERRAELVAKIAEAEEMLARTGRRRIRSPDRIAALKMAIVAAQKDLSAVRTEIGPSGVKLTDAPTVEARTLAYEDSTAKPGTFLHKLESGHYPLIEYGKKDGHFEHSRRTHGVFVPPQDVPGVFVEFSDVVLNPALKVARTYGIKSEAEKEDIISGAKLGFMLALRSYTGGGPFEVHARRYASVYAALAARDLKSGGGATIPKEQMQMLHGLMAARARAQAITGAEPSDEQVAKEWYLSKKNTFTGRQSTLGVYPHAKRKDKEGNPILVDQSNEQVPMEPWQVHGPDGKPHGREYPGKLQLIREMTPILDGSRVEDSQWINDNPGLVLPGGADPTLPAGTRYHIRKEVDQVLAELSPTHQEVLTTLFGLDPEDLVVAPPKAGEESRRVRGEDFAINAEDLADRLGLSSPDDSLRTKQRKAKEAVKHATVMFREAAHRLGFRQVADRASRWTRLADSGKAEPIRGGGGPTHGELSERFGGDDKLAIYGAAVRAGSGKAVAEKLDKLKAGTLPVKEREKLISNYIKQRDKERLASFRRQTRTVSVDPSEAHDVGPGTGTPSEADWLYTTQLEQGALQALVNGTKPPPQTKGPLRGTKRVWTEERFQRFMGREQQWRRAQKEKAEAEAAKKKKTSKKRKTSKKS